LVALEHWNTGGRAGLTYKDDMSEHKATVHWVGAGNGFLSGEYSREHTWSFDGGATLAASAAPSVVKEPFSNPAAVDPEEAFVASIASCHMLTFLHLASRKGFEIAEYADEAIGVLTKNERRVPWVSSVVLSPRVRYGGDKRPTRAEEEELHHRAHEFCFIANSVRTEIQINLPAAAS
jgi:organic hydroperoxide reductase OsmC/OhrA